MDLGHWTLDENLEPIPATLTEWAEWWNNFDNRRMARTNLGKDLCVSTVFLGVDHGFGDGDRPVLFETLVQGDSDGEEMMNRYTTFDDAIAGHKAMVGRVCRESDIILEIGNSYIKKRPPVIPRKLEYSNETSTSILREKIVKKVIKK